MGIHDQGGLMMRPEQVPRNTEPAKDFPALPADSHRDHIEALQRRLAEEAQAEQSARTRSFFARLLRRPISPD